MTSEGLELPGSEALDLDALLKSGTAPGDLSRKLFDIHLSAIAEEDPESARVAQMLAIPRRFDTELIGFIRGEPQHERDEWLQERLSQFNLVLPRRDHSFAYHDKLRHALLAEWQRDAPEQADEINERLAAYYTLEVAVAEGLQGDLAEAGPLIGEANPSRYAGLIAAIRSQTARALREAQYHYIAISPERGEQYFQGQCERLSSIGRLGLCEELIHGAREDLQHRVVAVDGEHFLRWVDYFEAHVARQRFKFDLADRLLIELRQKDLGQDDQLRFWTALLHGEVLHTMGRLRESEAIYMEALELVERSDPDPYNAPVLLERLGGLAFQQLDLSGSRERRQQALDKAREVGNLSMEVSAHVGLMYVALRLGALDEAVESGFTALDLMLSRGDRSPGLHSWLAASLMSLMERESCEHIQTLADEVHMLIQDEDNQSGEVRLLAGQSTSALMAGMPTAAGRLAREAERLAGGDRGPLWSDVAYPLADVYRYEGRLQEAAEAYDKLGTNPFSTHWDMIAAVSNSGLVRFEFDPAVAEVELDEVAGEWADMGHANYLAYVGGLRARALVRLGRYDEAGEQLQTALAAAADPPPDVGAVLASAQAELFAARCSWREAAESFAEAARLNRLGACHRELMFALSGSAAALASAGAWDEAAERASEYKSALEALAARDSAERPVAMTEADKDNATGVKELYLSDTFDSLHRARAAFRRAQERVPDDPWYNLNLAYTCAMLAEWTEAESAMDTVVKHGRPWDSAVLIARRDWFREQGSLAGQEPGSSESIGTVVRRIFRGVMSSNPKDA